MYAVSSEHLLSMKNLGPIIKLECFSCAIMCACCHYVCACVMMKLTCTLHYRCVFLVYLLAACNS